MSEHLLLWLTAVSWSWNSSFCVPLLQSARAYAQMTNRLRWTAIVSNPNWMLAYYGTWIVNWTQSERAVSALAIRTIHSRWPAARDGSFCEIRKKCHDEVWGAANWIILRESCIRVSLMQRASLVSESNAIAKHACRLIYMRVRSVKESRSRNLLQSEKLRSTRLTAFDSEPLQISGALSVGVLRAGRGVKRDVCEQKTSWIRENYG